MKSEIDKEMNPVEGKDFLMYEWSKWLPVFVSCSTADLAGSGKSNPRYYLRNRFRIQCGLLT
jgi:hypothetical protein